MGVQNGTILTGATISASGGTSSTLTIDGLTVTNGIHIADMAVTDSRVRPHITLKTIPAPLDPVTKKYGKGKRSAVITMPRTNSDGLPGFPVVRISIEDFPEMSDAEVTKLLDWAAQLLFDSDYRPFFKTGSLA